MVACSVRSKWDLDGRVLKDFDVAPRYLCPVVMGCIEYDYTYNERKESTKADGLNTWLCSKNRSKKYPCVVYFCSSDDSLNTGLREHNHPAEILVEEKKNLITSLKRKAADQQLSSTQNILTETLASSTPDLNLNLPTLEWLARAAQRSRSKSSGFNCPDAPSSTAGATVRQLV
ncbi:hypothetical protein ACHWQZ_G000672 [Mnemiopsis leidyi]